MIRVERPCAICGKMFMPKSNANKYCGEKCALKAKREKSKKWRAQRKETVQNTGKSLGEISAAARKEGLSYAKYVAKHSL